jgi:hypothetical protein
LPRLWRSITNYCGHICMQDEYAIWPMQGLPIVLLWNARTKLSQVEAIELCPIQMGTWGKGSQWCNRLRGIFGSCGRFCFGERECEAGMMTRAWLGADNELGRGRTLVFPTSPRTSYLVSGKTRPGDMGTPGRANKRLGAGSLPLRPKKPACSSHLPHSTL